MRKLELIKEKWWNRNPNAVNCENFEDSEGGISISNIGGVFIVIFVGIGLAIFTLIFEFWYYKYKKPMSQISSATGSSPIDKDTRVRHLSVKPPLGKTDYGSDYKRLVEIFLFGQKAS